MDDAGNKPYPVNSYGLNYQKLPVENPRHTQNATNRYVDEDENENENDYDDLEEDEVADNGDEEEDEEEDDDEDDDGSGVQRIGKDGYKLVKYNAGVDVDDDDDYGDMQKHPKKRKLKTLLTDYVFAPRASVPSSSKQSHDGRDTTTNWTDHETSILLNTWGERFLKQGRKSLHSEEWHEVAEKVSQESKTERTDTQCRNHLDTLKKKYKKEKIKSCSKWMYFSQMDDLLSTNQHQATLPCGVDAGEFIFMNPKVYLDRSNGLDEMCDSPENSESAEGGEDDMEEQHGASFKILADSIHKFNEVYQKVENSKRQQILELEKMRMSFHRELELQKRQILDRAQAEIQKIREGDEYDDNEASGDNDSG